MLDLALLRDRAFVGITLLPVVLSVSYWALLVFLPLYFERVQGYDALGSGMALLPFTSPILLLPPVGARLAQRDCQGTGTLQARSAWSRSETTKEARRIDRSIQMLLMLRTLGPRTDPRKRVALMLQRR
jgi:hypothetical protein